MFCFVILNRVKPTISSIKNWSSALSISTHSALSYLRGESLALVYPPTLCKHCIGVVLLFPWTRHVDSLTQFAAWSRDVWHDRSQGLESGQ